MKDRKPSWRVRVAYFFNRVVNYSPGKSNEMAPWEQKANRWRLNHYHVRICRLCDRDIMRLPRKPGWAAMNGVKENFVLCPDCYDKYDITLKK